MKSIATRGLALLVSVAALGIAIFLSELAFKEVLNFRLLERIPLSAVAESVGGESQLKGRAVPGDSLVKAPETGKETIYYRYLLERKERDSDGDTTWRTIRDVNDVANFYLVDETGRAYVRAHENLWKVEFSAAEKYSKQKGDYRHTEWRIDPNDSVTLFGWLSYTPEAVIDFSTVGHYLPIVSSFSGGEERSRIALKAVLWLWGGVSGVLLACFALVYGLRLHKTLVFLVIVSTTSTLLLFHYGYRSVISDVQGGFERVETHWQRANVLIQDRLRSRGLLPLGLETPIDHTSLAYSELSEVDRRQLDAWRLSAYQVRARYKKQIDRLPDSLVAGNLGMTEPTQVAVPQSLKTRADALLAQYEQTRIGDSVPALWLVLGLLILTAGLAWFSFRAIRVKRMQENIPTSKSAGVVFGLSEVKGTLVAEDDAELLSGPVTGEPCCWYHHVVKEKRQSGKKTTWVVVVDEIKKQPFYCEDEEGRIRVFPGQAECISQHVESEYRGNRQYTEWRLSPGDDLYVLGKAKLDKTRGDSLVFSHEKGSPYIIANIPEEEVMFRKAMSGIGLLAVALSALFLGGLFTLGSNGQLSSLDFLLGSLVSPIFALFVVFILMYNDLVFLQQRCDRNWANIQVSLKKRSNLVPQLEQVVKQYLVHEKSLQEDLVNLRQLRPSLESSGDVDQYLALEHAAIDRINLNIENYPDLEGIDLIAVFNRRLIKLENEISLIRAGFNDAVTEYRTRRETFPDNILASLFGFKPLYLLSYTEAAHGVPSVRQLGLVRAT
ncbi:MAG: hypothetical protein HOC70_14295 [Gammaproteobacteria bacterium]|nr:hypothetical protein [Gammaproteobacteria bacterium]MBT4494408.1 hypothetical protein [Gammaproteobacteria bacterium]